MSRIGATSIPVVPSRVLVPTTPGPIPTTTASAPETCTARPSAEATVTASMSPPNAWPAVTVLWIRPLSRRATTRSENAIGRLAPSVMT